MALSGRVLVVAGIVLLGACATSGTAVHRELAQSPERPLPKKVLLLPAEIRVHEISAGGVVEKVDEWSRTASSHATKYVRGLASERRLFELIEAPALGQEEQAQLDQHVALYELVGASAALARASAFSVWQERAKDFDYTLGPGLKALAERTGIDAAMIVIGTDYISSAGRRAAMVMGVLLGVVTGAVILPQGGVSFLSVGVLDMRTGNLLWFGTDQSSATDFRNERDLHQMLERMFQTYPGLAPKAKRSA